MKKFNYADGEIIFDDDFVFFHPYKLLLENQILEYVYEWDDRKKNTTSLDNYLGAFFNFVNYAKDSLAGLAVEILVENEIYEYDESRFLSRCQQELDVRNFDTYRVLLNRKANIVKAYNENEQYKAIQRASRSRWSGGGFGISGAIKGAVKAGAMNAVTGAVRGIGDSFRDSADQREYQERLSSIINQHDEEHLLDDMYNALVKGIEFNLFQILERRTGFDAMIVLGKCSLSAQSMFTNLKRENNVEKRVELYERILQCNPYEWEYVSYALSGNEDKALTSVIGVDNMRRIAEYLDPEMYEQEIGNVLANQIRTILKEDVTLEVTINKLIKIGVEYHCFDENYQIDYSRSDGFWEIGEEIILLIVSLEDSIYREKNRFNEESEKSYEKISHYIDYTKDILRKYNVYVYGEINPQYHESESLQELKKDLQSLEDKKKKAYINLCTSKDGHVYDSPEKAVLHNQEKMIYDKIVANTSPYVVYEKSILEELIKNLEEKNFQSKYIIEDINNLKRKLIVLRGHETTKHYEQGKKLRAAFETIDDCAGVYLYGKPRFVEISTEIAKKAPTLSEDLNTYFPILIVGKWHQEKEFKGIIITDEYIVVSGYLLVSDLRRPWNTLSKISVNRNKIELHFNDRTLKFKMSEDVAFMQVLEILAQYLKIIFEVNAVQRNYTEGANINGTMQKGTQNQVSSEVKERKDSGEYNGQDTIIAGENTEEIMQETSFVAHKNDIPSNCGIPVLQKAVQTRGIKERGFVKYILLSFLTCGIYSIYFWYQYTEDVNKICQGDGKKSPNYVIVFLLSCVTLGIYGVYWQYAQARRLYKAGLRYQVPIREKGLSILFLNLSFFVTSIVGIFIAQYIMIDNLNLLKLRYENIYTVEEIQNHKKRHPHVLRNYIIFLVLYLMLLFWALMDESEEKTNDSSNNEITGDLSTEINETVTITASTTKLTMLNTSQIVYITASGFEDGQLVFEVEDNSVVQCQWGEEWEGDTIPLTIIPINQGNTYVRIYLDQTEVYEEIEVLVMDSTESSSSQKENHDVKVEQQLDESTYEGIVKKIALEVESRGENSADLRYTTYDIDGDGQVELLMENTTESQYFFFEIYTMRENAVTKWGETVPNSERVQLYICLEKNGLYIKIYRDGEEIIKHVREMSGNIYDTIVARNDTSNLDIGEMIDMHTVAGGIEF